MSTGILLIVSGPSGSGKTTLCRRLTEASQGRVCYSVSCTTRAPREGERNGVDYYFLTREDFQSRRDRGEFLEWAEVHGNFYGTLKSEVIDKLEQGKDVIMDIDVQGAAVIRACDDPEIRRAYVDLFINVPMQELEARLRGRETDSEEVIRLRLHNAEEENRSRSLYLHTFDSSDRETDYARFLSLVEEERRKRA